MNYENKARQIRTADDLESAIKAGAQIEFTACVEDGDTLDMPPQTGGWIRNVEQHSRICAENGTLACNGYMFRAFYPVRRPLLSRLAFWRKAA